MKRINTILMIITLMVTAHACSTDVGGNEDKVKPVAVLTSLNDGEEVIGNHTVTWDIDEANRSTVDLMISTDSGATWSVMEQDIPDTGSYDWDSNGVEDCRTCRLRLIPTDIVGNVGDPVDSAQDFIVNNVPQVFGSAFYFDTDNDGVGGGNADILVIPFDKNIELFAPFASNFRFPVIGDTVGLTALAAKGPGENEISLSFTEVPLTTHLHVGGSYSADRLHITSPSGIDIFKGLPDGVIVARDTGLSATAANGIDIVPTFSDSGQVITPVESFATAFGDVDGDGDIDLVVGNLGQPNSVWLNNINNIDGQEGVFTDTAQSLGAADTRDVKLFDADGDGDLDMIAGNSAGQSNTLWINNITSMPGQEGVFTDSTQVLGNSDTFALAVGDVDDDGDIDIVTGNENQMPNRVWLNNINNVGGQEGVFTVSAQMLGANGTGAIALGDVDSDGDLDLLAGNAGSQSTVLWINNVNNTAGQEGVYTASVQDLGNDNVNALLLQDLDADSDLDIVLGTFKGDSRVYINNIDNIEGGKGVYTDSGQRINNDNLRALASFDIDDDGLHDLIIGQDNVKPNRYLLNAGAGIFKDTGVILGSENTMSIAVADIDNDGDRDLAFANRSGTNSIWLNSQRVPTQEILLDSGQSFDDNRTFSIAFGDIDGNGLKDFVNGNEEGEGNSIWLNNPESISGQEGTYVAAGALGANDTRVVLFGDVDKDGDIDLIELNADQPNMVWLNTGGVFTDSGQTLGVANTTTGTIGDVDGDGDDDLIAGNFNQGNKVWLNNINNVPGQEGIFTDSGQSLGTDRTFAVELVDVDEDGDLDMLEANLGTGGSRVWLNNITDTPGNEGIFTDSGQVIGNRTSYSVAAGDIDNDGDNDFVLGNNGGNTVWLNNINNVSGQEGIFTDSGQSLGNVRSFAIELVDIDKDGDLDIATGNDLANRLYLNNIRNATGQEGVFTDSGFVGGNSETQAIAVFDVDGDGDDDVVTGNDRTGSRVWVNDL